MFGRRPDEPELIGVAAFRRVCRYELVKTTMTPYKLPDCNTIYHDLSVVYNQFDFCHPDLTDAAFDLGFLGGLVASRNMTITKLDNPLTRLRDYIAHQAYEMADRTLNPSDTTVINFCLVQIVSLGEMGVDVTDALRSISSRIKNGSGACTLHFHGLSVTGLFWSHLNTQGFRLLYSQDPANMLKQHLIVLA